MISSSFPLVKSLVSLMLPARKTRMSVGTVSAVCAETFSIARSVKSNDASNGSRRRNSFLNVDMGILKDDESDTNIWNIFDIFETLAYPEPGIAGKHPVYDV